MSYSTLMGETFIKVETDAKRERAMQQFNRHPRRHPKRHLGWPFGRDNGPSRPSRPAVS